MNRKQELIEKLVKNEITNQELVELLPLIDRTDFRTIVKRIFDINESEDINNSGADKGILGFLNRIGRNKKNRKFKRQLRKPGFREGKKVIVAEGDSWFEYPVFIKDIIDWIIDKTNYPVYSLAYGGDWIANILYEEQYINELSLYQPEVFLISGGGNDIVGGSRLAKLVDKRSMVNTTLTPTDQQLIADLQNKSGYTAIQAKRIAIGYKFLNKDFYALLNLFRILYSLLFRNIELSGKFSDMKIITQGYDFGIPSNNKNIFKNPLRLLFGNGKWMYEPLVMKGIVESEDQRSVVAAIIFEFNEMLIQIGRLFQNVYHIDSRGLLQDHEWADELHAFSRAYERIADKYIACINSQAGGTKALFVNTTVSAFK
jgi:hypothetical protein